MFWTGARYALGLALAFWLMVGGLAWVHATCLRLREPVAAGLGDPIRRDSRSIEDSTP